jgi:protein-disulfide isomerase
MKNVKTGKTATRRQEMKDKRRKRQQRQRYLIIAAIVGVALLIVAAAVLPPILRANRPVGEFALITPVPRPNANGTAAGDPNAPVRIEVYMDFQCPACKGFAEAVEPQIINEYVTTGKAYYMFRHYPFIDTQSVTKESQQSANASMCAMEQERFWDYHDMLVANWNGENEGAFTDQRLLAFAESLGLEMKAFEQCFDENRYEEEIQADRNAGLQAGVTGTPSVFVNGVSVGRPGMIPTYDEIKVAVEAGLSATQ